MLGTCKFYDPAREFGFVLLTEGSMVCTEYFFHRDNVLGPMPRKGDACEFLVDDPRGGRGNLVAVQVKRIGYPD
jgi:cold shock CspA family protein